MGVLAETFQGLLDGLSKFDENYPKLVEKFTGTLGAERDLEAFNLLVKSFDKNLSGAVSDLTKAKPEKLPLAAKNVFDISKLYLSKISQSKDGYMTSAAEGALETLRDTANKIMTAKTIDKKQIEVLKKSADTWSTHKNQQKVVFENKVKVERIKTAGLAKILKDAWADYKKINVKTPFDLVRSWEIAPEGKKRSLADPVKQKVEAFLKGISEVLMDVEKFDDELYKKLDEPMRTFSRAFWNAYAVVKEPDVQKLVKGKPEESGMVGKGEKK